MAPATPHRAPDRHVDRPPRAARDPQRPGTVTDRWSAGPLARRPRHLQRVARRRSSNRECAYIAASTRRSPSPTRCTSPRRTASPPSLTSWGRGPAVANEGRDAAERSSQMSVERARRSAQARPHSTRRCPRRLESIETHRPTSSTMPSRTMSSVAEWPVAAEGRKALTRPRTSKLLLATAGDERQSVLWRRRAAEVRTSAPSDSSVSTFGQQKLSRIATRCGSAPTQITLRRASSIARTAIQYGSACDQCGHSPQPTAIPRRLV